MFIYSSLYIGEYFLFLLAASDINPIKLYFREHETKIKAGKSTVSWKEKIYMYPAILQRKWIEYKYKDKFIPPAAFDNVLPCELNYNFLNRIGKVAEIKIKTIDKQYKNITFQLIDKNNEAVFSEKLDYLTINKEIIIYVPVKTPGVYNISISTEEKNYSKSEIIFYSDNNIFSIHEMSSEQFDGFYMKLKKHGKESKVYCNFCKSRIYPVKAKVIQGFIYKNYIPFKEYVDIEGLGMDYIIKYIMNIKHPAVYKRGLVHLLNIIRLASIQDELTIVANLFKDDPTFAYYITDKLFFFNMIPIMNDKELQRILNDIDDTNIARSLIGEKRVIVKKILNNISARRRKIILSEMGSTHRGNQSVKAKNEMHKLIRLFFEERFGRILKIPYIDKVVYYEKDLPEKLDALLIADLPYHSGEYLTICNSEIFQYSSDDKKDRCLGLDVESYKDKIVSLAGITESTIYLKSETGIRYAFIHIYNWITNLEDYEFIENISIHMIIPFKYTSSGMIFTIGAIDSKGKPLEQVIRLKIKDI